MFGPEADPASGWLAKPMSERVVANVILIDARTHRHQKKWRGNLKIAMV